MDPKYVIIEINNHRLQYEKTQYKKDNKYLIELVDLNLESRIKKIHNIKLDNNNNK